MGGKFYVCTDGPSHPDPRGFAMFWNELDKAVVGMGFRSVFEKFALPIWLLRIVACVCDSLSAVTGRKFKLGWFTLRMLTIHRLPNRCGAAGSGFRAVGLLQGG